MTKHVLTMSVMEHRSFILPEDKFVDSNPVIVVAYISYCDVLANQFKPV